MLRAAQELVASTQSMCCRAMVFVPVPVEATAPNAGQRVQHARAHAAEARHLQDSLAAARALFTQAALP